MTTDHKTAQELADALSRTVAGTEYETAVAMERAERFLRELASQAAEQEPVAVWRARCKDFNGEWKPWQEVDAATAASLRELSYWEVQALCAAPVRSQSEDTIRADERERLAELMERQHVWITNVAASRLIRSATLQAPQSEDSRDAARLDWLLPNLHPANFGMEFEGGYEWDSDAEYLAKWRAAIDAEIEADKRRAAVAAKEQQS